MARKSEPSGKKESKADRLRRYLESRPAADLGELVLRLYREHAEAREQLDEMVALQTADVEALIKQARREVRQRTQEEVDSRPWGLDHLPDYSKLKARFEA